MINVGPWTEPVLIQGFVRLRNCAGPTRRTGHWEPTDPMLQDSPSGNPPSQAWVARDFDADDVDPAQAARMSFDQMDSTRTSDEDHRLSRYLMKNWHTSPFEMVQVWLEMKLPIFVARQLVRHRTVALNEVSGRYVQLPAEWYIPLLGDVELQTPSKKQGGKMIDLSNPTEVAQAQRYQDRLRRDCKASYDAYLEAIADGIAMEQARLHLHLNHFTHWLWSQNLHNLFHMLSLRSHQHAQQEARMYAETIDKLVRRVLPVSFQLYDEYRRRT